MSSDPEPVDETAPAEAEPEDYALPDSVLQDLQWSANGSGGSVGVTVLVGGALFSGRLVGGREFFELQVGDLGTPENFADLLRQRAEEYPDPEDTSADPLAEPDPHYLHLADAVRVGPPWFNLGCLRVRLGSVDGWSFGRFGPPGSSEG